MLELVCLIIWIFHKFIGLYQLRFELNSTKHDIVLRFGGFTEKSISDLKTHLYKNVKITPRIDEVASTGWHWGNYSFDNSTFKLRIDQKYGLEIDAKSVTQVTVPSKTDLAVELKPSEYTSASFDELVEIRFCVASKQESDDAEIQLEDLKQV